VTYQLLVHGGYNIEYHHFSDPRDLAEWLVDHNDRILEVMVYEV